MLLVRTPALFVRLEIDATSGAAEASRCIVALAIQIDAAIGNRHCAKAV